MPTAACRCRTLQTCCCRWKLAQLGTCCITTILLCLACLLCRSLSAIVDPSVKAQSKLVSVA